MSARLAIWLLVSIMLLGLAVRCDHLADRTVWFDEAFSYTLVSRFAPAEIVSRTAADVHPPFYYLVLWVWTRCFGASPVALRAPSVLLGVATIGLGYVVARDSVQRGYLCERRRSRGRAAGVACASLIAFSAAHVRWSWEARMYTLATTLLLASAWCLLKALDSPRRQARFWWGGFACCATALLYTHNYGLFSFVGLCLWLQIELSRSGRAWIRPWKSPRFAPGLVSIIAVCWGYLPWVPTLLAQKAQVQDDYWIPPVDWLTLPRAWYSLVIPVNAYQHLSDAAAAGTGAVLLALAGLLWFRFQRVDRLSLTLWLTPVLISLLISLTSVSLIVDRHFLLAHLCALVGVAGLVADSQLSFRYWGVIGLLTFDSIVVLSEYRNQLDVASKPGIRGAIAHVLAHRQPDESILVLHPCIYFSARYYLGEDATAQLYVPPERVTHYTGAPIVTADDFFPLDELDDVPGRRVWVLDTNGFTPGSTGMILPATWQARESTHFADVYLFQGSVTVTIYERRDAEVRAPQRPVIAPRAGPTGA